MDQAKQYAKYNQLIGYIFAVIQLVRRPIGKPCSSIVSNRKNVETSLKVHSSHDLKISGTIV